MSRTRCVKQFTPVLFTAARTVGYLVVGQTELPAPLHLLGDGTLLGWQVD